MLRLAFDFIITWRETRTRPNAYYITLTFIITPTVREESSAFLFRIYAI